MFHKSLFILAHQVGDRSFYPTYKRLVKNQWNSYEELQLEQEKQLRHLIEYSYEQIPYYHTLFKRLALQPRKIRTIDDLEKLPILTKEIVKTHWEEFKPANLSSIKYISGATGGSTGTPFQYRLSSNDRFLAGALLYRGWGNGGYNLGDRMAFLAGTSLDSGIESQLAKKIHEFARNIRKLSSFDMDEYMMRQYANTLTVFNPRFIRGYASSIFFFARWLEENDINISNIDAIFTTAEKLYPHMRKTIEQVFGCKVFDAYGLYDGGVSAYECSEHSGLHIDTERSLLEIVDDDCCQIMEGEGKILATSLHNFAMPFIRYATGDIATLADAECGCGRHTKMLSEVVGRTVDILVTPEGKNVHGWFFLMIFWEHGQGIKEYQVTQLTIDEIVIKIVPDEDYDATKLETIKMIISSKSTGWNVQFMEVESIDRTRSGKYKFITNEMVSGARQ